MMSLGVILLDALEHEGPHGLTIPELVERTGLDGRTVLLELFDLVDSGEAELIPLSSVRLARFRVPLDVLVTR